MTFPLRTFCSYHTGIPQDIETCVVANILRMKQTQLVVAGTTGNVQIYKVNKNPSAQDMIVNYQTASPIIGIGVGIFSSAHNSMDDSERLELAVIHSGSIEILQPKKSYTGVVELYQTAEHQISRIVSFAIINKVEVGQDENKNKRQFVQSYVCVKTLDSYLIVAQKRIVAKVKLGFRYSMPSPLSYCPLADLLVIGTFEYSVIGIYFSDLLQQYNNVIQDKEAQTDLKVVFEFALNDRIQQILCGRFFRGDSAKTGEICVVLTRQVVFLDCSGKIVKEIRFDSQILNCSCVYSRQNKYSEILSLLVLEKHQVSLVSSGAVKFKNQFQEYSPEMPKDVDETSEALSARSSSKPGSEYDDQDAEFVVAKAVPRVPMLPKQAQPTAPMRGTKPARLNLLSYPINIVTAQTISQYFNTSNHAMPDLCPDYPGLFGLCYADGTVSFHYFGTSHYNFQKFSPVQLPSNQASKQLKEQLLEELKEKQVHNKATCEYKLECSISNVAIQQQGIQLKLRVVFESSSDLIDVTCHCVMLGECEVEFSGAGADKDVAYLEELDGMRAQVFTCTILLRSGKFLAPQNIYVLVTSVLVDEELQHMKVSVQVPLPVLAHNILGILPPSVLKHHVDVQFKTPFGSLSQFLQKKELGKQISGQLAAHGALAIKNLDGSICLITQENTSLLRVSADKIEQLYAGLDVLLSYDESCAFKYEARLLQAAIAELSQNDGRKKALEAEDKLGDALLLFYTANQEISRQMHAAIPGSLEVPAVNGRNIGQSMEILTDYIDGLCRQISQRDGSNKEAIERLRGVACLLVALRHKEAEEIYKYRSLLCGFASQAGFQQLFGQTAQFLSE